MPHASIAIVGSGIAGNSAAWALARHLDVTQYEAEGRFGGHACTLDIDIAGKPTPVDAGFIVYNTLNYPNLIRLFETLGVETQPTDMSFGVSLADGTLEYRSEGRASALLAQKRNLLRPRFWRMGRDILRFYRAGPTLDQRFDLEATTLRVLLAQLGVSQSFIDWHIVPMTAAIWSAPFAQALDFPAATFVQFFRNHGLFSLGARPPWRTVTGGSRRYVAALHAATPAERLPGSAVTRIIRYADSVEIHAHGQPPRRFDQVVLACHADQALALIDAPSLAEQQVLGAFRTAPNLAVVHGDARAMPRKRSAWASWNYVTGGPPQLDAPAPVTYWMNNLQGLDPRQDIFVSLNPQIAIAPDKMFQTLEFRHPVFDLAAIRAQRRLETIQGADRLWFCGAWTRYGFHEDGCASGLAIAGMLAARVYAQAAA